jgi:hypothetical protein
MLGYVQQTTLKWSLFKVEKKGNDMKAACFLYPEISQKRSWNSSKSMADFLEFYTKKVFLLQMPFLRDESLQNLSHTVRRWESSWDEKLFREKKVENL